MSEETMANLSESVKQLKHTTAQLAVASDGLADLMQNVNQISMTLAETIPAYRQVGIKLESELLPAVQQVAVELGQTAASANSILLENRKEINQLFAHDIPNIVGMTDELARSIRSINDLASSLDNEPMQLIYGERVPELEIDID
jgi:ABC-type transporter Mla subunit MlaD